MKNKRSDNPYRYTIKVTKFKHDTSNMDVRIKRGLPAFMRVDKISLVEFCEKKGIFWDSLRPRHPLWG